MTEGVVDLLLTIRSGPEAPRLARQALDRHVRELDHDDRERLMLALSEVVSNVVRHGDLREEDEVRIAIRNGGGTIRGTVEQPTTVQHTEGSNNGHREGGFGLRIVDATTDRWGMEPGPPGRVWFEVRSSDAN